MPIRAFVAIGGMVRPVEREATAIAVGSDALNSLTGGYATARLICRPTALGTRSPAHDHP